MYQEFLGVVLSKAINSLYKGFHMYGGSLYTGFLFITNFLVFDFPLPMIAPYNFQGFPLYELLPIIMEFLAEGISI